VLFFHLLNFFLKRLDLIRSKDVLSLLENFKIKYRFESFKLRNNFHYWNFLKFGIEVELKIKETLRFDI
jgi:hypothetical protein